MYSKSAMPQLMRAAIIHGLFPSSFKWAYHAKVMNILLQINNPIVMKTGFIFSFI